MIRAMSLQQEWTTVSSGFDTATGPYLSGTKVDVSSFVRASLYVEPGATGADFTVLGYRALDAPAETIYAKATSSAGAAILDAQSIEGYAYVEVYEHGTEGETQAFYLLAK